MFSLTVSHHPITTTTTISTTQHHVTYWEGRGREKKSGSNLPHAHTHTPYAAPPVTVSLLGITSTAAPDSVF